MKTTHPISQEEVVSLSKLLPSFPLITTKILAAVNDSDANLNQLAGYIEQEPVIATRVLSLANRAVSRLRNRSSVMDIYTAISMIGIGNVREMVLVSCVSGFSVDKGSLLVPDTFWQHSVAVSVCAQELAQHFDETQVPSQTALLAGLLHDIGTVWLYSFRHDEYLAAKRDAARRQVGIENAEQACFGVDHAVIGGWICQYWGLPDSICFAIKHHHAPEPVCDRPMVALLHVGEVMTNALDLGGGQDNRVTYLSTRACEKLGLIWGAETRPDFISLFGRITARARHASALFLSCN